MNKQTILKMAAAGVMAVAMMGTPAMIQAQGAGAVAKADTVLKPADMERLLPASVFYRGQSATTQLRNSGGVKFADGYYILAALVDTSGYSSNVAAKYQAYFITEVPIQVGGQALPAGVYGVGFVEGSKFVVTDVGGHDLLTVTSGEDAGLKRPMPLQVMSGPSGDFRLYAGRRYVSFIR
jgi:hypothetical protein